MAFLFQNTTATRKIFGLKKRIRAVAGGTSASKTISILVWCIDYCQSSKDKLVSIVSESFPHLEKGAIADFKSIMKAQGYWDEDRWHETKHTYFFETGSRIEFFSPDSHGKVHGPRRDVLFANECNHLEYKIIDQLITRTREIVWMDWNPSSEFWFYTDMLPNRKDIDFITLTYKDNEALDISTVMEIESHKNNKMWWTVYGEGQLGEITGRIYTGWQILDEIPHAGRLERRGIDFGYTNDPTSVVDIYYMDGGFIIDEVLYQKGMLNSQIANVINAQVVPNILTVADSAEPKSIDELKIHGINIVGAEKGPDSVRNGIQMVQDQKISVTKRSTNVIREYRNYMWATDKDGNYYSPNQPEHTYSHSMDAVRYAITSIIKKPKVNMQASPLPAPWYGDRDMSL